MGESYKVFKRGPGTMTSARNCDGVWLRRVENFGKAEMLGEFDSATAAESRAAELLATDRFAIYLICQGIQIVESVSDAASQEALAARGRRTEKWVKLIMVLLYAAASWFIWRKLGSSFPLAGGAVFVLAVALFALLAWHFNPVEAGFVMVVLLALQAIALPALTQARSRARVEDQSAGRAFLEEELRKARENPERPASR